jgi:AcrR family transcriptional regulator
MTETSKRAYSSDLRTEQARRTRKQIVDAAAVLFAEQGFAGTTVDAIAKAAGVSRKTVFTAVPGGKTELLKLAYDFTLAGDDEPVPMIAREGIQSLIREPDPYRQMRAYARFITTTGRGSPRSTWPCVARPRSILRPGTSTSGGKANGGSPC